MATPMAVDGAPELQGNLTTIFNHAGDGATLRCGVSVLPPVRGVAGCHSLHLPRAQEICPHPLAKDAKVSYN